MRFTLLDVFTDRALTGNQLAVHLGPEPVPAGLRQDLAREIGFSETVFVEDPSHPTAGDARLRIHTPASELPFAGHPVLGSAVAVAAARGLPGGAVVTLECGVGPVPVELGGDGTSGWMRQPLPTVAAVDDVDALLAAASLSRGDLAAPVERYDNGPQHVVVAVRDPDIVRALLPDVGAIARILGSQGLSVCALTSETDVVTRMFAPGLGVSEDAATGSAAGPVAVHLLRHGLVPAGRELTLSQGEAILRPSTLLARVEGLPDAIAGVAVGGAAVVVGELTLHV